MSTISRRARALLAVTLVGSSLGTISSQVASSAPATVQPTVQAAASPSDAKAYPTFVPLRQGGSGVYQWDNCGPVSALMVVRGMGKTPASWNPGNGIEAEANHMRKTAMLLPGQKAGDYDRGATNVGQLKRGLGYYGIPSTSYTADVAARSLAAAREGRMVILSGNARHLPKTYTKNLRPGTSVVNHFIVVAGYERASGKYLVMDPMAAPGSDRIHRFTAQALTTFVARGTYRAALATTRAVPKVQTPPPPAAATQLTLSGVGDATGDGKPDIYGYHQTRDGGSLTLYRGNGKGGYATATSFGAGWGKYNAVLRGDFDGDRKQDLLARTRDAAGNLKFYKGTGSGGFTSAVAVRGTTGWGQFDALVSPGDLSGDGKADVLARRPDGTLLLYRGTNAPGVSGGVKIASGWNRFRHITSVGDITGDGRPDVAAIDKKTGQMVVYRGTGSAAGLVPHRTIGAGWQQYSRLTGIGDHDGDGTNSIAGVTADGRLHLYKGRKDASSPIVGGPTAIGRGWTQFSGLF